MGKNRKILKILIAVDKNRFKYLQPFAKGLLKYNIESKIIDDLEIYDNSLFSKKILRWFNTPSKFNQIIKDYSPDFIFTERTSHFSSLVLKTNIPLIIFIRGNMWIESEIAKKTIHTSLTKKIELDLKNRITEKCFKNKSTIILPICNYLTEIIKNRYPKKNIKTFYQGIEIDFWKPLSSKNNLIHPCVGLLQGAHIWGKAQEMLTLEKVLKKFPNITFYWAGDGPYAKKILSTLEKYPNFKWLGNLDYPDKVRQFLTEIDIYALISGMDMSPHTVLESSLMEKPVIATNVGGIPELIKDGETGFLVEKGNHEQIIEKISFLLENPENAKKMGIAGKKFIEENFSWGKIAEEFKNIIDELESDKQ